MTGQSIGTPAPGHYGPASTGVTLAEATIAHAWNVQGDAALPAFADGALRLFGIALPAAPNTTARNARLTALWLGPTSWLLVASEPPALAGFAATRDALAAAGGALFDVTASCSGWTVAGPHAATILAGSCPLEFHPRAFAQGACAQSMLGRVNALIYRRDASAFTLIVARSYARSVWRTLCRAAAPYGYDVVEPQRF
jgi:sarcosine oxidase, subunit gamma